MRLRRGYATYPGWVGFSAVFAIVVALPLIPILIAPLRPVGSAWSHIRDTVLLQYVLNTVVLVTGTAVGAILIGTVGAWILIRGNFSRPIQGILQVLFVLPLAVPVYISTYTWSHFLSYGGTLARLFASTVPIVPFSGLPAGLFVLIFGLYPYVFLTVRAALLGSGTELFEAVASLTRSKSRTSSGWSDIGLQATFDYTSKIVRGVLPTLRPAVVGGGTLVAMEALNAYATPVYLGVPTVSTGVFRTWFSLGDLPSATRLAGYVLFAAIVLLSLERAARGRRRFGIAGGTQPNRTRITSPGPAKQSTSTSRRVRLRPRRVRLRPRHVRLRPRWRTVMAVTTVVIPPIIGFVVPVVELILLTANRGGITPQTRFVATVLRSVALAGGATVIIVTAAVVLNYAAYLRPGRVLNGMRAIVGVGYAIPGTVIAIGVLAVFRVLGTIDERLFAFGTIGGLLFAYAARYSAPAIHPIRAAFEEHHRDTVDAARVLGSRPFRVLQRIVLPLFRPAIAGTTLLVAIDIIKDIPMTLLLRPFDFSTLAVEVHRLAGDERLAEAAPFAVALTTLGLITIILTMKPHWRRG